MALPQNKNRRHTFYLLSTVDRFLMHLILITFPTSLSDFTSFDMDLILITKRKLLYFCFQLLVSHWPGIASNSGAAAQFREPTWQMGSVCEINTVDVFHSILHLFWLVFWVFPMCHSVLCWPRAHTHACASSLNIFIAMPVAHQRMIFRTLCNYRNAVEQSGRSNVANVGKNNKQLYKNYNVYLICDTLHTFFGSTNKQWNLMWERTAYKKGTPNKGESKRRERERGENEKPALDVFPNNRKCIELVWSQKLLSNRTNKAFISSTVL